MTPTPLNQSSTTGINRHTIYTDVIDFPEYQIGNNGHVISRYTNTKLSPSTDKDGYYKVNLWHTVNSKRIRKTFRICRLVAIHFLPNPDNLPQVNHKDTNKKNDNDWNLEWCTQSINIIHGVDNGLYKTRPVIQFKDGIEIGRYQSCYKAEEITGIRNQNIWACLHGRQRTTKGFTLVYESEVVANVIS